MNSVLKNLTYNQMDKSKLMEPLLDWQTSQKS